MRTQSFHPSTLSNNLFRSVLILLFSFLLTSCKQNSPDKASLDTPKNWIVLNVKFKPNTSIENREASISTIEKFLLRRVDELREKGNPDFKPYFITRQNPLAEPMTYQIRVGNDNEFGTPPPAPNIMYVPPPTCTCINKCGVCDSLLHLTVYIPNSVGLNNALRAHSGNDSTAKPVTLAEYIETFDTADPEAKKIN